MSKRYRITVEVSVGDTGLTWLYLPGVSHAVRIPDFDALDPEKLPPRSRPVRKGDEVLWNGNVHRFVTIDPVPWDDTRWVVVADDSVGTYHGKAIESVTHADGAPIDWEASE